MQICDLFMTYVTMKLWNKRTVGIPQHIAEMPEISRGIYSHIFCKRFEDLNYNLTTLGQPGTGKTTTLLKMAYELQVDPRTLERNFDVEQQVVFTTEGFTNFIKNTDERKDPGKVIIFDEIEIEANSKSWDTIGQVYALTISTCRYKKNIIFASLPLEQQLILHGRELRNARITCNYIDHYTNKINAKYENLDYTVHSKDTYGGKYYSNALAKGTFFRFNKDDIPYIVDPVWFGNIPHDMDKKYKKMKFEYLKGFYERQTQILADQSKKKHSVSAKEVWDFIDTNKNDLKNDKGLIDPVMVHSMIGIPLTKAKDYVRAYNFAGGKLKREIKRTLH